MKKGEFHYRKFLKDDTRRKENRVKKMRSVIEPIVGMVLADTLAKELTK